MYFQIGAHPAFYWPLLSDETIENGVDAMTTELAKSDEITKALEDALGQASSTFGNISKSIEETTEIQGVNTVVNYTWGDEVLVTKTFTSADAE